MLTQICSKREKSQQKANFTAYANIHSFRKFREFVILVYLGMRPATQVNSAWPSLRG